MNVICAQPPTNCSDLFLRMNQRKYNAQAKSFLFLTFICFQALVISKGYWFRCRFSIGIQFPLLEERGHIPLNKAMKNGKRAIKNTERPIVSFAEKIFEEVKFAKLSLAFIIDLRVVSPNHLKFELQFHCATRTEQIVSI